MSDMNTIKYNEGGSLSKKNKEMLMNQAIELKHHADELMKVLEKSEYIEPWVVAKAERATTDLSDITHYLEGNSRKMKYGGYMQEGGEVSEFSLEQFLNFIYPNVKEIMDSNNISIDKEFLVSKDMQIAYVPHFMYEYEDDKVSELAIYYFDAQDKSIGHIEIDLEEKEIEVEFPSWSLDDEGNYDDDEYANGGYMADGGMMEKDESINYGGMMAKGGATFKDKVKSISKRLDKTKVPLKYRKEYGKYFSKKEATQSAQRIVGSITKKEK